MTRSGFGLGVGTGLQNFVPFTPTNLPDLQLWLDANRIGVQGYSLDFDGTDDYVQADNEITAYPFTLECWVRLDVVNANQSLVSINNNTSATIFYSINAVSTGKANIRIENGATTVIIDSNSTLSANTWTHIAGVFESATDRKLYINGLLESSNTTSVTFNNSASNRVLMGVIRTTTPTFYLNGKLSDVRIWNTARTAQQIADNYQKRLIGNESGLVGYWKLDKGSGTTVEDSTSNANTGTITGAIWDNSEPLTEAISDNTAVRVWADQSGKGYDATQSTTAARPTYRTNQLNGLPAVVFDGTDDIMPLVSGSLGMLRNVAGATVFAVVKYPATLSTQYSIFIGINTSTTDERLGLHQASTGFFRVASRRLDANSYQSASSTTSVTNNFVIHSALVNYQNTLLQNFVNGALNGQKTDLQTAGNTSDTNSSQIAIGSKTINFLNGAICEIIVYNRALNTSELAQVHKYLSMKWGI